MPNRRKEKGDRGERELVNYVKDLGFESERGWGSRGASLGEADTVDVMIDQYRVQVKRRAKIAKDLFPPKGADVTAMRADHGKWHIVIPLEQWLELIK